MTKVTPIRVAWGKPQQVKQGRKTIPVETAIVKGHKDRFHLYNNGGKMIPTMWTLWDASKSVQWFLYGEGWEGARKAAAERIAEILQKEKSDETVPRPHSPRSRRRE